MCPISTEAQQMKEITPKYILRSYQKSEPIAYSEGDNLLVISYKHFVEPMGDEMYSDFSPLRGKKIVILCSS
mgnify:CR=1 FL=1